MIPQHYNYKESYANELIRGIDISPRSWVTQDIAKAHSGKNKKLLDIGCGNAYKTLMLKDWFEEIIALEPSIDMLTLAALNIKNQKAPHIHLVKGISQNLPFAAFQFDVITAILTWWKITEVHKVIKPQGVFICESLGPEDKTTFTQFFGKDELGWRGANLNTDLDQIKQEFIKQLSPYFGAIQFENVTWETAYNEEGLLLLLQNTKSTVRNFCAEKDRDSFETAMQHLKCNDKIILKQNRFITIASKPIFP